MWGYRGFAFLFLTICAIILLFLPKASRRNGYEELFLPQNHFDSLHFVVVGLLRPVDLVAVDSAMFRCPGATVNLHVLITPELTAADLKTFQSKLRRQLQPLESAYANGTTKLRVRVHSNLEEFFLNTPLDGAEIPAGYFAPKERVGKLRSSDIFRLLVMYKEGGVYLDSDMWVLKDIRQIPEAYGSLIVAELGKVLTKDLRKKVCNFLFAFKPGSYYVEDVLRAVRRRFLLQSKESLFHMPDNPKLKLTIVGPDCFTEVFYRWAAEGHGFGQFGPVNPSNPIVKRPEYERDEKKVKSKIAEFVDDSVSERNVDGLSNQNAETVVLFGREYFSEVLYSDTPPRDFVLSSDATIWNLESAMKWWTVHVWEMEGDLGKPKDNLLEYFDQRPNSVLSVVWRKNCFAFCSFDVLGVAAALKTD